MKAAVSASQPVNQSNFFSKTADRIFMKFHTKFWFLKDKKLIPTRKNYFGKKPEIFLRVGFFGVSKKFVHWCAIFGFTWCTVVVYMIPQKPHVLGKSLSKVIYENARGQSDCNNSKVLISQKPLEV